MSTPLVDDADLLAMVAAWLPEQRWFAGKNDAVTGVEVVERTPLTSTDELTLEHLLLRVHGGQRTAVYQVPVSHVAEVPAKLAGAVIGHPGPGVATPCDALRDPRAAAALARLLSDDADAGRMEFRAGPGVLDPEGRSRTLGVEQSNTTVVYDDAVLVKWFRQVPRGINPDVELHEALSRVGCPAIAELRGEVTVDADGETVTLAMVQEFLPGCADGWSMATASVRDLLAEADLLASEVGTDFADEAHRLGGAVARVHADLAAALGAGEATGAQVAESMRARLEDAVAEVPELGTHADAARTLLDRVAALPQVSVQRVHGDLHLGQTLRGHDHWVLIDFEGEPSATLAERRRPDSPLRDVAGMLRSLDYAAGHALVDDTVPDRQRRFRAREWTERNTAAFCEGYADAAGTDPRDPATADLLRAFLLDKALYEVVYETRNRPAWASIPAEAVARLVASE